MAEYNIVIKDEDDGTVTIFVDDTYYGTTPAADLIQELLGHIGDLIATQRQNYEN